MALITKHKYVFSWNLKFEVFVCIFFEQMLIQICVLHSIKNFVRNLKFADWIYCWKKKTSNDLSFNIPRRFHYPLIFYYLRVTIKENFSFLLQMGSLRCSQKRNFAHFLAGWHCEDKAGKAFTEASQCDLWREWSEEWRSSNGRVCVIYLKKCFFFLFVCAWWCYICMPRIILD